MEKSFRSTPWTLVGGATVWIGLAVGVAFVSAREPAKAPAPSRSVEPIVEDEAVVEALVDEASMELMEVSEREPWNEFPESSDTAAVMQEIEDGGIDVAPALVAPAADGTLSVLVHFDRQADTVAVAGGVSPVRASVRNFARQQLGRVQYEYEILPNVVNVRGLTPKAVAALKRLPGVAKVEPDYEVHTMIMDAMPLIRGLQTQITAAGLSATGAGVRVCVIDTGIDSNSIMYSTRIDAAAGWDFVNNDSNPEDDNGHGSHCAGTVLGGANVTTSSCLGTQNAQGVAPQATLIGVKVLNSAGNGSFSNVIAGINRCASPTLPGGQADVISLSLGGGQFASTCDTDTAAIAANNAVNAGVVVVAAAGNDGFANATGTPACGSKVIAVAATYDKNYPNCDFPSQTSFNWGFCIDNNPVVDQRVCFSNRSTKVDVAAPGCIIFSDDSTVPAGNGLVGFCGTSQATPHVAGLAALLLSANPSLTPAQVQGYIRSGAIDKGTPGFDTSYGYGRIDVINSLQLAAPGCTTDPQCSDGLFCNGAETCSGGTCHAGTAPNCADAVACTTDSCNEGTDSCDHTPNNGACSDGLFCNGSETCHVTLGCQAGTAPNCADAVACTTDSCNEGTDSCDHTPNNGACSDGLFCNGSETCHVTLGCQAGTAPNCADAVACTDDSCNEGTDSCDHVADDANCDDGLFCNGAETCNATLGCQAGGDPCPGQVCDEPTETCADCLTDGDCSDGLFCNGAETCNAGTCEAGTAPNCADAVACTTDSCNESTDSCDHTPNNGACNDGLFCNGTETCNVSLGCQAGTDPCAPLSCDEGTDSCVGGAEVWMSFVAATSVPSVGTVQNEDIVARNVSTGAWSMIFDGSDVGLSGFTIDGMARLADGSILLSFTASGSVAGMTGGPGGSTTLDDSDIVRFIPTSLGSTTAGSFVFYFDGSDVGLTTNNENIDAIAVTSSGQLVISTLGAFSVTGASGVDADLLVFTPTSLGSVTAGTWAMYFDGSDVGYGTGGNEDVDAAAITPTGTLLLSTNGNFSVPGLSGANEDVIQFTPTSLGSTTAGTSTMYLDLSTLGIATGADVGSVEYKP